MSCFFGSNILKIIKLTPDPEDIKPGVVVMITIFSDFRQFSAKKLAFFLKNQCYDQNFA
jgi:hypothetical protein